MQQWVTEIMQNYGYWGILFLILVENLFPPIPSEVILTFGGFMTTYTTMSVPAVIAVATLGSVLGALVLYGVGRIFQAERLERWLTSRWARFLHFKRGDVALARDRFTKSGLSSVLIGRCIPIVRSLISIPAGMAKMKIPLFLLYTTLGSAVWNTLLVVLGRAAGQAWVNVASTMDTASKVVLVVLVAVIILLGYLFYKNRIARKA